jgi:hypothetical protein
VVVSSHVVAELFILFFILKVFSSFHHKNEQLCVMCAFFPSNLTIWGFFGQ